MPAKTHLHTYRKFKTERGKTLWRCMDPECVHFFYGNELIAGRKAACGFCGEPFEVRRVELDRLPVTLICEECTEKRKKKPVEKLSYEEKIAKLRESFS